MRFLILGPLEAYDGDRKLALGGTKQRALLAMLLLHANEVVSSDRLVDTLWDAAGPEDSAKALSVHRSTLKYRLLRIREISGHDLGSPDVQFNLQLAIRAWRTQQAVRGAPT